MSTRDVGFLSKFQTTKGEPAAAVRSATTASTATAPPAPAPPATAPAARSKAHHEGFASSYQYFYLNPLLLMDDKFHRKFNKMFGISELRVLVLYRSRSFIEHEVKAD